MDDSTSPLGAAMASSSSPAKSPETSLSKPSMKSGAEKSASTAEEEDREKTSSTSFDIDDDEEEEEEVCRICRNPGDSENPLRYPCACSGSIKFVHQDCLLQWLNHSNARQCEVLFLFLFNLKFLICHSSS